MAEIETGNKLEYPHEDWKGFLRNHFGPSITWALLGVGSSHLVLGPTFSATFGFIALWSILLIYLVKYGCWELGIRYNYAVGENMFDAYSNIPGPKLWPIWLAGIDIVSTLSIATAAVGISAAAFLNVFANIGLVTAYTVLIIITAAIIIFFQYEWLERFLLLFAVSLTALVIIAAITGIPSIETISRTAVNLDQISNPSYVAFFASAVGLVPTSLGSTWLLGSWSLTKNEGASELKERGLNPNDEKYHDYIASWIRVGVRDFRIGYLFSIIVMVAISSLAITAFYPNPPTNQNLAVRMGQITENSLGTWSFYVIVVAAFAALWSTVLSSVDGFSTAFLEMLQQFVENTQLNAVLGENTVTEPRKRLVVIITMVVSSAPVLILGQQPVTFVLILGLITALVEVFIYPANLYIVKQDLPKKFQPTKVKIAYYLITIVIVFLFGIIAALSTLGIL